MAGALSRGGDRKQPPGRPRFTRRAEPRDGRVRFGSRRVTDRRALPAQASAPRAALPSPRVLRLHSLLGGSTQRRTFGALLVAGWAIYTTVVVASNLTDLLASFGWIHTAFRSGNLAFIQTATRIYFHSRPIDQALLGCVVLWEAAAAALLWYGAVAWSATIWRTVGAAEAGLIVIALLWMALATATEIFVAYDRGVNESAYWVLAVANLITLVVVTQFRCETA